jgi:hypothetical protein
MAIRLKYLLSFVILCSTVIFGVACSGTSANAYSSPTNQPKATTSSSSSLESEANAAATNYWVNLLNSNQGVGDNSLLVKLVNTNPNAVISQIASKSQDNEIDIIWQDNMHPEWGGPSVAKGESIIKSIQINLTNYSSSLTTADKANGITWQGSANFNFIIKYRVAIQTQYSASTMDLDQNMLKNIPYSQWENDSYTISLKKQNGSWLLQPDYLTWNGEGGPEVTPPFRVANAAELPVTEQPWLLQQ